MIPTNTGWLTSGPKVIRFENEIKKITNVNTVVCVNLDFWSYVNVKMVGVGAGDTIILSYTYSATALLY